jgi:hypothetical protein
MPYQWRFPHDSGSGTSPLTTPVRPKYRPPLEVPTGTVASRIRDLQNLTTRSSSSGPSKHSPRLPRLENSRTGFGRRADVRFGKPASRFSKPDGSDIRHSFVALHNSRIDHKQDHAFVTGRPGEDWCRGLNGQIQPRGMDTRVQYESMSPANVRPKLSPKDLRHGKKTSETEVVKNIKSANLLSASVPPSSPEKHISDEKLPFLDKRSHASKPGQRSETFHQRSSGGRTSAETTHSMRRQSVRDLYHQYGIERPIGLLSSEFEESPLRVTTKKYCHMCYYIVEHGITCSKCDHHFCKECHDVPSNSMGEDGCVHSKKIRISEFRRSGQHASNSSKVEKNSEAHCTGSNGGHRLRKKTKLFHEPELYDTVAQDLVIPRRPVLDRKSPSRDLLVHNADLNQHALHSGSRNIPPGYIENLHQIRFPHQVSTLTSIIPSSVGYPKEMNDLSSTVHSVRPSPMVMRSSNYEINEGHISKKFRHRKHHRGHYPASHWSSSSTEGLYKVCDDDCDNAGCLATHSGHQPYRHSISCTKHRQSLIKMNNRDTVEINHLGKKTIPEGSKSNQLDGRKQEQSHGAQLEQNHQTPPISKGFHNHKKGASVDHSSIEYDRHNPQFYRELPQSAELILSYHEYANAGREQNTAHVSDTKDMRAEGYVECYGYPKTGHNSTPSQVSPVIPGTVGQCQHCLDDCKCNACQNTDHSVRCCMHDSHQPIPHRHSTKRMEPNVEANKTSTSQKAPPAPVIRREQPTSTFTSRKWEPVNVPTLRRGVSSPPWTNGGVMISVHAPTRRDTLVRNKLNSLKDSKHPAHSQDPEDGTAGTMREPQVIYTAPLKGQSKQLDKSAELISPASGVTPPSTREVASAHAVLVEHAPIRTTPFGGSGSEHLEQAQQQNVSSVAQRLSHTLPRAVVSCDTIVRSPSDRSTSISPQVSNFIQIQQRASMPVLYKRLQDHQEMLRRVDKASYSSKAIKDGESRRKTRELDQKSTKRRLELTERQPLPTYGNDSSVSQHILEDDEIVEEIDIEKTSQHIVGDCEGNRPTEGVGYDEKKECIKRMCEQKDLEHDCVWKHMVLENSNDGVAVGSGTGTFSLPGLEQENVGVLGVTVVIHLDGIEDLVLKANMNHGV